MICGFNNWGQLRFMDHLRNLDVPGHHQGPEFIWFYRVVAMRRACTLRRYQMDGVITCIIIQQAESKTTFSVGSVSGESHFTPTPMINL